MFLTRPDYVSMCSKPEANELKLVLRHVIPFWLRDCCIQQALNPCLSDLLCNGNSNCLVDSGSR